MATRNYGQDVASMVLNMKTPWLTIKFSIILLPRQGLS